MSSAREPQPLEVAADSREPRRATEAFTPLPSALLECESRFYGRRLWCLDAFPTVDELRRRLFDEVDALTETPSDWRGDEVARNVFLLACALADAVDDYLGGDRYDFARAAGWLPGLGRLVRVVEWILEAHGRRRARRLHGLRIWRGRWGSALDGFLQAWRARADDGSAVVAAAEGLRSLLVGDLPGGLRIRRAKVPAAFRTQDLTDSDITGLADRCSAAFPDRTRPILIVGLRTAGSYFAPLVHAVLASRGHAVASVTLRPKKGLSAREAGVIARCAASRGRAVVVDEPADTGRSLSRAVGALRQAGLGPEDILLLIPVHPTRRDWNAGAESLPLAGIRAITLAPEAWHKHKLLETDRVERQIHEYAIARGYAGARLQQSATADAFNRQLLHGSDEKFHTRLKRVYQVRLQRHDGRAETRYVLAKSVGWGWLGYHAFLASQALADFVPPVFGLRDGILYTEWLPGNESPASLSDRPRLVQRTASYVATRARALRLVEDPAPGLDSHHQKGAELLAAALSGAYGWKVAAVLKRARLRHELTRRACPVPTLIDGRMRRQEWIDAAGVPVKTDFEHHGLGKTELNVTDPAYDLADAILHFDLSPAEERALLRQYRELSGDAGVEERLLLHKLLAGTAASLSALDNLKDPGLTRRHPEFNRGYLDARAFLTTHMARYCGGLCRLATTVRWSSPLVVLDIDGVLDKQVFGFPSTTAAGIEAVSLLHAHGFAIALNTARTLAEAQEYCRDYGCVGAVAEYGSVAWDAITGRTRVLVTAESRRVLRQAADALRRIPGVFLNERYEHSLRAYAFEGGRTVPLPTTLVHGVLAPIGLERVAIHQTYLDTAVLARGIDKGNGLLALLQLAGVEGIGTIAIGDSEPDLAMFRVASRSFAPSHISGRAIARLLGCHIVAGCYQPGLRSAVASIVHPDGGRCDACASAVAPNAEGLLWELLQAADRRPMVSLMHALLDPMARQAFAR
jgi:hydroxymethylpyrimidine pyrophosphatase-like HAD family hydrolase